MNDIAFHPNYGTLATVGSDGRISFWDKDARTKLKTSEPMPAPVTRAVIHSSGQMLAYAIGYDWSKVNLLHIFAIGYLVVFFFVALGHNCKVFTSAFNCVMFFTAVLLIGQYQQTPKIRLRTTI